MHKYSRGIPSSPFVPLNGFRIDLSFCTSERKRNREIGSGKPLERPQTGGCGIGRGVVEVEVEGSTKGKAFHYSKGMYRTIHPHQGFSLTFAELLAAGISGGSPRRMYLFAYGSH